MELAPLMNSILNASSFIKLIIPNWYDYSYDARFSNNYILDGGFDMFDNGNQVTYIIIMLFCVFASLKFKNIFMKIVTLNSKLSNLHY